LVLLYNHAALPEIYTLSLHDALPILEGVARSIIEARSAAVLREQVRIIVRGERVGCRKPVPIGRFRVGRSTGVVEVEPVGDGVRSEEHTSELQSRENLVCRLLLEKKK